LFLDRVPRTTHLLASTREMPQQRDSLMEALKTYRPGTSSAAYQVVAS